MSPVSWHRRNTQTSLMRNSRRRNSRFGSPLLVSAKLAHPQMGGGRAVVYAGTAHFEQGQMAWVVQRRSTGMPRRRFAVEAERLGLAAGGGRPLPIFRRRPFPRLSVSHLLLTEGARAIQDDAAGKAGKPRSKRSAARAGPEDVAAIRIRCRIYWGIGEGERTNLLLLGACRGFTRADTTTSRVLDTARASTRHVYARGRALASRPYPDTNGARPHHPTRTTTAPTRAVRLTRGAPTPDDRHSGQGQSLAASPGSVRLLGGQRRTLVGTKRFKIAWGPDGIHCIFMSRRLDDM